MAGRATTPVRRARTTLALAGVVLAAATVVAVGAAIGAGRPVGAQEGDTSTTSTSTSTSTTGAPPTTIELDDGDYGVVPPGAEPAPEEEPPEGEPAQGEPADGQPQDPDAPADGAEVPEELPVVILPDPTPGLNAALAAIDVTQAEDALAEGLSVLEEARARTGALARSRRETLAGRREALEVALDARRGVEAMAVNVLMFGDIASLEPVIGAPDLAHLRNTALRDVAADHLEDTYDAAVEDYRRAAEAEAAATRTLQRAIGAERRADDAVTVLRGELDDAIEAARDARRAIGPPILGPSVLEADDLVAWYDRFYPVDPPVAPVEDIIELYLSVAADEGVTGDIAFAQAILETGGFRSGHARGHNFAGIGAYDSCAPTCGFRFSSLEAGVRAHLHLLRAYADPAVTSSDLAAPPDRRVAPERVGVRGCCPRWTGLTGVWASDPNYDRKVLGIYRLMVETARDLDRARVE